MFVSEGGIELSIPGESTAGIEAEVFYNPRQVLNRDLTIATLRAFSDRQPKAATYLDAMTASGVRGIRAAKDGWDVTCCDRDETAISLAKENIKRNDVDASVKHQNVNALMHESMFDVIDLDPYGTPMPYADAAFSRCRNLICVTATDTAPLCGAHFNSGIRSYGAVPRTTEYHREMGVRILLSGLARSGARFDVGISPLFTHATSHYVRTYLELDRSATAADMAIEALGYIYHCEDCLHRETSSGLIAVPPTTCPACAGNRVLTAGPVWLDSLRNQSFTQNIRSNLSEQFDTFSTAVSLLETIEAELDEPTHYDQHRLCKLWNRSAPSMDAFLDALEAAGFAVSRTHYGGTTFKTDATVSEIESVTESIV